MLGGDIILAVNGNQFENRQSVEDIMLSIKEIKPGSKIDVEIWREGKKRIITLSIP